MQVIRYETIVRDPTAVFGAVITWLGQSPPLERLKRAIRFSSFEELRGQEKANGFKERTAESDGPFFQSGKPGHWREVLSPAQQARIERDHGTMMQRFGYL